MSQSGKPDPIQPGCVMQTLVVGGSLAFAFYPDYVFVRWLITGEPESLSLGSFKDDIGFYIGWKIAALLVYGIASHLLYPYDPKN